MQILVNDFLTNQVPLMRGVRQADPCHLCSTYFVLKFYHVKFDQLLVSKAFSFRDAAENISRSVNTRMTLQLLSKTKSLWILLNVITSNSLNSLLAFNRVLEDVDNLHNTSEQTLNIQIDTLRDIDEEVFFDTSQDPARLAGVTQRISRQYNC